MSDVPAAAAWAVSVACALGRTPPAAFSAGVAAAVAILIRPNLAPIAGIIFLWLLWRGLRRTASTSMRSALWFLVPAAAGAVAVAVINARLYGSPLASGYDLTDGFLLSYVWPNIQRYGGWLISAETPFALAGLAGLAVSNTRLWRTDASRDARWLLGWDDRARLGLVPGVRAVGRVVVSPVPAAGLADDDARHGVAGRRRSTATSSSGGRAAAMLILAAIGVHRRLAGGAAAGVRGRARGSEVCRGREDRRIAHRSGRGDHCRAAQRKHPLLRRTSDAPMGCRRSGVARSDGRLAGGARPSSVLRARAAGDRPACARGPVRQICRHVSTGRRWCRSAAARSRCTMASAARASGSRGLAAPGAHVARVSWRREPAPRLRDIR